MYDDQDRKLGLPCTFYSVMTLSSFSTFHCQRYLSLTIPLRCIQQQKTLQRWSSFRMQKIEIVHAKLPLSLSYSMLFYSYTREMMSWNDI